MPFSPLLSYGIQAIKYFLGLSVLYIVFIYALPPNQATLDAYDLTETAYKLVLTSVAIPTILVWLAAFIGYSKIEEYAYTIRKSKEGKYFKNLARGVKWLAWSLPVPTIISVFLNALANSSGYFHTSAIIISNLLSVILAFIAFSYISYATNGLASSAKIYYGIISSRIITMIFVILGVLYSCIVFFTLDLDSIWSSNNQFFLPIWLIVATIMIPYLYAWFVGLLAAYEISLFSRKSHGVLYKRALGTLALGLVTVIFSLIAQQYMNSLLPRAWYLVLDYRIILLLLFKVACGVGFVVMTIGAIRLKRIEEV